MMVFVAFLKATEYGYGTQFVRLVYHYFLETTFKSLIFLKIFLILVERGGADTAQLAAGKSRLKNIGGIHGSLAFSCTYESMDFVNKQYNVAVGLCDFIHDGLETFFKFTFIFCTGHKRSHIQRVNLLVFQILRHIATHYTMGKPLGNSGLSGTRLTNQHRIVLCAAA